MYLTQLFSALHLSEALLSRECVRIGWLATAAKGRLGAPYFSWEKSEGCSVHPPSYTVAHPLQGTGTLSFQSFFWGPSPQACKELKASDSFCLIVQSLGGLLRERGWRGRGKFVWDNGRSYQDGVPPALTPRWADKTKLELFSHNRTHWYHSLYHVLHFS